jgi:hypothetical protein
MFTLTADILSMELRGFECIDVPGIESGQSAITHDFGEVPQPEPEDGDGGRGIVHVGVTEELLGIRRKRQRLR